MNNQLHDIYRKLWLSQIPKGVTCEGCGKELPTHGDAINFMLSISIGVPGHPVLPSAQCPEVEHWACSIDCWTKVAHQCIDEHLKPLLQAGLQAVNGHPDTINIYKKGVNARLTGVKQPPPATEVQG